MSVVVIVLPKLEDAKKIRKILMGHGFPQVFAYATASAALSEIREHESGMVISGYHLKDMYYTKNAKILLMERNHLSEEEAHRYIQKSSMDNGTNMVETAQMILTLLFEEG